MRRILLALAVLPLSCLAQSVTVNPPALTPGLSQPSDTASGPVNPSAKASAAVAQDAVQGTPATRAPTASEQGYDADANAESAQALADFQATHTARQLGQIIRQPAPLDPVAANPRAQGWLANWTATLVRAGVPETKVAFEAHRLDREAFAAWAHRQLLSVNASF